MRVRIHSLQLPPALCVPEQVSMAAVQLELAGVVILSSDALQGGTFRPRAGGQYVASSER